MVEKINVKGVSQIKKIMNAAIECSEDVGIHDAEGSIADAKSILGLMRLDYSHPVNVVTENAGDLQLMLKAIRS